MMNKYLADAFTDTFIVAVTYAFIDAFAFTKSLPP